MAMLCIFTIVFLFIIGCWFPKVKSLSGVVRFRYGNHVLNFIRKYEKIGYVKSTLILSFLENDPCPTFLRYKMSSKRLQKSESYRRSQRFFYKKKYHLKPWRGKRLLGRCS